MLIPELIHVLLAPVSTDSPCGDDLEYDPAFITLESAAQRKPEQQFGDTLIPAIEPEWQRVLEQSIALLERSKDLRVAMLLVRAATRQQGLHGFVLGMQLLSGLLELYWSSLHPALDADDDNDSTMRLNALAPMWDDALLIRDLYDASIGDARGVGLIRVRDLAIARNALSSTENSYSLAQIDGGLQQILNADTATAQAMQDVGTQIASLQQCIGNQDHSGRVDVVDLTRLRNIGKMLSQAVLDTVGATAQAPAQPPLGVANDIAITHSVQYITAPRAIAQHGGLNNGAIASRQEALELLDAVIQFLQQSEPGNPAPLLIQRAKKLIGVSFLDIIGNLAPEALAAIEQVTGASTTTE